MKIRIIAITGMLSLPACGVTAAEVDSKVIHNYNYLGVGYGYLHDFADLDIEGHGAVGEFSFEEQNFVLNVSGGYFWMDDVGSSDVNLWNIDASIGYVFRLMQNHVNLIPRFGGSYVGIDVDGSSFDDETWSILPGVGLSFAINNRFAINGGYTYAYNFDSDDHAHLFNAGGKFALAEQIGLSVNAAFSDETGFSGITGILELHY